MNIEFGCGDNPREGFLGCDIRPLPGVTFVCNAWEIADHVNRNSVSHVYSRHFFEHLTFEQADNTFRACREIMQPGAKLEIIVPDMAFHIGQWMNLDRASRMNPNGFSDLEWAIRGFWGHQRTDEHGSVWDTHKSGYDFPLLSKKLKQHGFRDVRRVDELPKNLTVEAFS